MIVMVVVVVTVVVGDGDDTVQMCLHSYILIHIHKFKNRFI